jgi:SAM-dependent methyltransferase
MGMMIDSAYERGDYDHLYENYLGNDHDSLRDALRALLGFGRGPESALDLCAGTGHLTQLLVASGLRVMAVDKSSAMLEQLRRKVEPRYAVQNFPLDLNKPGALKHLPTADLITCRQGIGYLDSAVLAQIPTLLNPGGSFLFNSFVEPPRGPWWHSRGKGIYEAGFYLGGRVYHLQARWPRFDVTHFRWHDVNKLKNLWLAMGYTVLIDERKKRTLVVKVTSPPIPT